MKYLLKYYVEGKYFHFEREFTQEFKTIKEKDDKNTTVTVGYENTENASAIEKMTGANIYNVVCEAIKKLG